MSASVSKKSIRVFPKIGEVNDQIALEICNKLIKNCKHLERQLQYRLAFQLNYIEILFAATDGEHYLDMDFGKYHFWELAGSDFGGADWIREVTNTVNTRGETAFYSFDRLEFIGNQETLTEFYQSIYEFSYENQVTRAFRNPQQNKVEINIKGIYTANTVTEIGEINTRVPQRKKEFNLIEEFEGFDNRGIETILFEERGFFFQEFFLDEIGKTGSVVSKTNNLEGVNFYSKNKKIRTYKWIDNSPEKNDKHRYGYWKCNNADWWENCVNPKWVKFFERKKKKAENKA